MKESKVYLLLCIVLLGSTIVALLFGATHYSLSDIANYVFSHESSYSMEKAIFFELRLPRVILTLIVGAILGITGFLLQSLFRNPIIEPGLIGISSGAAFGAALFTVFGSSVTWICLIGSAGSAIFGALLAMTFIVFFASSKGNKGSVVLLLTGIAINALFYSGVGMLTLVARDPQARSITFWNLGSFSGADWNQVVLMLFLFVPGLLLSFLLIRQLEALQLGEEQAFYLGFNPKKIRYSTLILASTMIAIATSFVGVIAFVGLVVPHLSRRLGKGNFSNVLFKCCFLGAIITTLADLLSRLIVSPAEVPLGIVTSLVGVPFFLWLLKQNVSYHD
ncbi:MAG: hypothetical protein RL264_405 [Bacteroidota bacterium]|jgi:iron complex transport system permease protein